MPTIYLMRHGQAEMQAPSDAARQLTAYGQDYTKQIATQLAVILRKNQSSVATLLHSPYQRASATAQIVTNVLQGTVDEVSMPAANGPRCEELLSATPDSKPEDCFAALSACTTQSVMLVSHMPLVAALASLMEHGNVYQAYAFETSEIRIYEMDHWIVGSATYKYRLL